MGLTMPSTCRFIDIYKGDKEWLAGDKPTDPQELGEWHIAWAKLRKDCEHQILFVEEMYNNQEYGDKPEWVDVTLKDDCVLVFKMARGVIKSINADSITYSSQKYFDATASNDFRVGFSRLSISEHGAFVTLYHTDGAEEVEVNITEFFNQAIGE